MSVLFGVALLIGAALLFVAEATVAREVLPRYGGSPSVWTTCMVVFQATLLAAYAYVHLATTRLGVRRQAALHACLLVLPLWQLRGVGLVATPTTAPGAHPARELIGLLLGTIGPPFFVVAATAPLLQRWYSATGHPGARDPYFLYGLSNLGSLVGLLAYPLAIEPRFRLAEQGRLWAAGYAVLAALTFACAVATWRRAGAATTVADVPRSGDDRPGPRALLSWAWLAFVPSSLLLGVTASVTTDLATVPLLWALPMSLYLLSFVVAFARRPPLHHAAVVRAFPFAVMALVPVLVAGLVQPITIPLHLLTFFLAALACHGELARGRPGAADLTSYYLAIAVGGALGGAFNALIAPIVFDRVAEYPLGVFLACLCLPGVGREGGWRGYAKEGIVPLIVGGLMAGLVRDVGGIAGSATGAVAVVLASGLAVLVASTARRRPLRFALGVGAVLLAGGLWDGVGGRTLLRARTFFGASRVTEVSDRDGDGDGDGVLHRLFHGTTLHGQQRVAPGRRPEPLTYYHRGGPIGDVFGAVQARPGARSRVLVVGLGAGSLAAYARPGERWTFYEIDPAIVRIARDPGAFTFLRESRAGATEVVVGDARLRLREAPDGAADLIVLDAFSSDAIPTHLLTVEAIRLYRSKLADGGLIALHLSNRTIDLDPVVGRLARHEGLVARVRHDRTLTPRERRAGKSTSIWAVLASRPSDLGPLATDPRWRPSLVEPGDRVWTDDYSSILPHLVWWGGT